MSLKIKEYLKDNKNYFENRIKKYFPAIEEGMEILNEAMLYSLLAGGKRIRPVLALAIAEMFNVNKEDVIPASLAIEMIHTYSLIHDDLPCMDDDDFRRGKPTSHKKFGEDIAVLAGDSLLTEAFGIISKYPTDEMYLKGKIEFISELTKAAGANGMVGGQIMDMLHPESGGFEYLKSLHKRKTGAMIKVSCLAPLILNNANKSDIEKISKFGDKIGLLFQVADDILDVTATLGELGKTPGKDEKQNKLTYVTIFGLEKAKDLGQKLVNEAVDSIKEYKNNEKLIEITKYILNRTN